jgi:hypothetical protein
MAKYSTNTGSLNLDFLPVLNIPLGGNIGVATNTVDKFTVFEINQTTSGQTLTLPNPSATTRYDKFLIKNVGTTSFIIYGRPVVPGDTIEITYNGTVFVALSGSGVLPSQTITSAGATILTDWNKVYLCDTSLGNQTITLPDASLGVGMSIEILKTSSDVNTVTVVAAAGDIITGINSNIIRQQSYATTYRSTGINSIVQVSNSVANQSRLSPVLAGAFTASINIDTYRVSATAPFAITLPLSTTVGNQEWVFKKVDATNNLITVTCSGADTLDGTATYALFTQNQSIKIASNNLNGYNII